MRHISVEVAQDQGTQPLACGSVYVYMDILLFISLREIFLKKAIFWVFSLKHGRELLGIKWWWENIKNNFCFATDIQYYYDVHYKLFLLIQTLDAGKNWAYEYFITLFIFIMVTLNSKTLWNSLLKDRYIVQVLPGGIFLRLRQEQSFAWKIEAPLANVGGCSLLYLKVKHLIFISL